MEITRGLDVTSALAFHRRGVVKTLALWLGLAALMVQGLAPLCAAGSMGGLGGGVLSVLICTAHGFQTVQIGADGKPLPHQPANTASDCCSACHAPNGFTVASPVQVAVPSSIAAEGAPVVSAPVAFTRYYSSYVTRGPPAAISRQLA